jgi:FMN phosphatase YigB (HAD superfamily)
MTSVRSFDVFDTVLTRRVGAPSAVFDVLAGRLSSTGSICVPPEVFASARRRYERRLNQDLGRHATLREIYVAVALALNANPVHAEDWALAEEQLERELTVAVPSASERIADARGRCDHLVFVSDTPHSQRLVQELLLQHGLADENDGVFTSSEQKVSKSGGGLFRRVAHLVGEDFEYVHVGDNPRSDVAAARVEGWSSSLLPDAALSRYEKLLESTATETDGLMSWVAGASRISRLEAYRAGMAKPIADVASGAFAPMLVGYSLWVVATARRLGVRRLYFVARDGHVMLEAARHTIGALAPDIELRYLYGSRRAWIFGASGTCDETLRSWLTVKPGFTARTMLNRVALTPEEVFRVTRLPVTGPDRADDQLSAADRQALADVLQQEPLLSTVRERARQAAERTTAYFRQEGLLDGVPSALVDAGWRGRTAAALDHLVTRAGAPAPRHLVIGLTGAVSDVDRRSGLDIYAWLFDKLAQPVRMQGFMGPNVLVEMWCAGVVGRTIDYAVTEEVVVPLLERDVNEPVLEWGVAAMQAVAVRVAELVTPHLTSESMRLDTTDAVLAVMKAFWNDPTPDEVAAWGTFPWEEEVWQAYLPIVQKISTRGMVSNLRRGDVQLRRNNTWRAGSAIASTQPWRAVLKARTWQAANEGRLRRLPRRLRLTHARFQRR